MLPCGRLVCCSLQQLHFLHSLSKNVYLPKESRWVVPGGSHVSSYYRLWQVGFSGWPYPIPLICLQTQSVFLPSPQRPSWHGIELVGGKAHICDCVGREALVYRNLLSFAAEVGSLLVNKEGHCRKRKERIGDCSHGAEPNLYPKVCAQYWAWCWCLMCDDPHSPDARWSPTRRYSQGFKTQWELGIWLRYCYPGVSTLKNQVLGTSNWVPTTTRHF